MSVPDYQTIMRPLLESLARQGECNRPEIISRLALEFDLSSADLAERLPGGRLAFSNRVDWAITHLRKAALIESSKRGWYALTERGAEVLSSAPQHIDKHFLSTFPEFQEFLDKRNLAVEDAEDEPYTELDTPDETLAKSYFDLRDSLADELLDVVKSCSPKFFESLVVDLLLAMGYGGSHHNSGQVVGRSGDGQIDGIISEDKLGLEVIYVQAKRWNGSVGSPEIMRFVGGLDAKRARKGIFITTSYFTDDAKRYVEQTEKKIILIDGSHLAQLMIDHDVGVYESKSYTIKKVDSDYFAED